MRDRFRQGERIPPQHVDMFVPQWRQARDVFGLYRNALGLQVSEGRVQVERIPQHDHVHHQAQGAELIFLPLTVARVDFSTLPMKDPACQAVATFAPVERRQNASGERGDLRPDQGLYANVVRFCREDGTEAHVQVGDTRATLIDMAGVTYKR